MKRWFSKARRSGDSGGTNNLQPILFHQVHGDNICIAQDGTVARRVKGFWRGITFSSRPIKVAEKVCVKLLEVSDDWIGFVSFGFTCNDPNNLRYVLPESVFTDLIYKPGYWVKALEERFMKQDAVLFYYVTQAGNVHFGINGKEKGVFSSVVETREPLWAIIDVFGNLTAIELVDPQQQLNNSCHNLATGGDTSPGDPAAIERLILPSITALTINQQNHQQPQSQRRAVDDATKNDMPRSRFQQPGNLFNPLPFHRTHGRNIRLSNDRCIASRTDTEFCHGYVFTARPIQLGEKVVIQVLATGPMCLGTLAFGLTSCDPSMIQGADLPDDSDLLLDRPEYWVVRKHVSSRPQRGDEFSFCITHTGEVQFSKNGSTPVVFMHVDQTLPLWAFFDVCGNTQKVRILGSCVESHHSHTSSGTRNLSPPPRFIDPALAAGRLHENLPCSPVSKPSYSTLDSTATMQQVVEATSATGSKGTECTICCERPIDSVLYMCGHMCMCHECAIQQWRGNGGGRCPICRAVIRDVIRTYKS